MIQGRDSQYQAIYKLKGKPLNTHDKDLVRINSNKELKDLITILGCGIGSTFDISKLRFHKIILATDSDIDGSDIKALFDGFMYKHMPELIMEGYYYHALSPLYKIKEGKKEIFIQDKEKYNRYIEENIMKNYTLIKKNKEGKLVKLTKDNYSSIFSRARYYIKTLNDVASNLATPPEVIENIILYKNTKSFDEVLKKLNLSLIESSNGKIIEGLYNENYICLILNDETEEQIERVASLSKEIGFRNVNYITKDKKIVKELLGSFLVRAFEEATPKYRQRFKGLGEKKLI